jgi:SAM-dependent methyltransferase
LARRENSQEGAVDREEVARRLEKIRGAVRDQLAMQGPADFAAGARQEVPFHMRPAIGIRIGGDPGLAAGEDLAAANRLADPDAFEPSKAPVVGPLVNFIRRLTWPLVRVLLGSRIRQQQQLNAHLVRHLNDLGNRLEHRVQGLEEALEAWSANPGGIEARLERTLEDYDAALRQRHMTLFSALEEEMLVAHTAAHRAQKLEEKLVERAQAVDRRFAEKDEVLNEAVTESRRREKEVEEAVGRVEGQIGELMALRSLLRRALESAEAPAAGERKKEAARAGGGRAAVGMAPERRDDQAGEAPSVRTGTASAAEPSAWSALGDWMGDEDYRSFQARFRGDPEMIAERMRDHVARFSGTGARAGAKVADLGCGRGEFLDLLRDAGIEAVGVEINAADVEECRRRGHQAVVADLFDWLAEQDDGALGGIFMAQVIEHLPPMDWQRLVELAARKLTGGGRLVIETINPESLYALARAYVIDPTHVRPVHPQLLSFLARRAGLHPVEIELQSPVPDDERATGVSLFRSPGPVDEELAALKEALVRLDRICCAPQEYTLQATRPISESEAGCAGTVSAWRPPRCRICAVAPSCIRTSWSRR